MAKHGHARHGLPTPAEASEMRQTQRRAFLWDFWQDRDRQWEMEYTYRVMATGSRTAIQLAAALWFTSGCMSHVEHGRALYANGHYVEAAAVFEHGEVTMADASPKERAQYGTYRGLTLLVLGDIAQAQRWLTYAYAVEQRNPGSINERLRAHLDQGWYDLLRRTGPAPLTPPPGAAFAVQNSAPPATPEARPVESASGTRRSFVDP